MLTVGLRRTIQKQKRTVTVEHSDGLHCCWSSCLGSVACGRVLLANSAACLPPSPLAIQAAQKFRRPSLLTLYCYRLGLSENVETNRTIHKNKRAMNLNSSRPRRKRKRKTKKFCEEKVITQVPHFQRVSQCRSTILQKKKIISPGHIEILPLLTKQCSLEIIAFTLHLIW